MLAACASGGDGGPSPGPSISLTGAWTGAASDSSGPGKMTWQLQQSGDSVSGTVTMTDTETGESGQGTLSGTVSGSDLSFTLRVPVGGFSGPYASCSSEVTGRAQFGASSITGTYAGTNSCSGYISSGQLTLGKS